MQRSFILLCGLLLALPLRAADPDGKFAVDGVGARSCAEFTSVLDKPEGRTAFANWSQGFLTAYNVFTDDTFDITPWQPQELVLAKMAVFCRANPDVVYINGLSALIRSLIPDRVIRDSPLIAVRHSGKSVFLYRSMLARLRGDLNAAGYDAGAPDAPFADGLIRALRAYQEDQGLVVSGLPDGQTLNALYP
ncbi:hypothetical protein So717_39280 [Roseobacter cerasinus]|uniref:Peptidoglycan binding-like domain-containing protein n=1 Tax=Roseobacter cerasinus TaxID=2602289 RepID=A0A640VYY8_9RHOB|nr:peptidoglycan-binding domain-containing protein [Roseobacter cerasinus]GFE52175.1 hypothetical protein So717_39280 [Roseobacter cerasinus]